VDSSLIQNGHVRPADTTANWSIENNYCVKSYHHLARNTIDFFQNTVETVPLCFTKMPLSEKKYPPSSLESNKMLPLLIFQKKGSIN